jgi:type IV pilus assembly protein PilM
MAKKLTTVYIEDNEIKLLVSTGKEVEKWASAPLDSGMVNEGVIIQEDAVAERLKNLAEKEGVSGAKAVAAISGQNSIFRLINIPEVPKNILDDAIYSEAARVIPVPLDQVYLSRQQLATGTPHEMRFFLAAHPKNATDALIRTMHKAGLKSTLLDIAPLALARVVNLSRCIVVNSRESSIDIILMVGRIPEVIRSFSVGAETIPEAERTGNIAEEIARTITFYNSSHTEAPMGADVPILVSGDLAKEKDIWPTLGGQDGRPVELLTSGLNAPAGFDAPRFMVNLGLAQRDMGSEFGSLINLNALPAIYLPRGVSWFNILAPVAAVLMIGVLVYSWIYIVNIKTETDKIQPQIDAVHLQIIQTQAKIPGLQAQITAANNAVKPILDQAAAIQAEYTTIQNQRSYASGAVRSAWIQKTLGAVTLSSITWDGSHVVIAGTATDSESNVFSYATALRSTYRFQNVIITDIVKRLTDDTKVYVYDFTLTLSNDVP